VIDAEDSVANARFVDGVAVFVRPIGRGRWPKHPSAGSN